MKWSDRVTSALRRWFLAGFTLCLVGVLMHFVGGRSWDGPGIAVAIAGVVVIVAGCYRHPPARD